MRREGALLSRNLTPPLSLGLSWPPGKFSSLLTKFLSIISDLGRAGFGLPASCSADLLFQNPIRLLSFDMMMIYRDLSLTLYIWSISGLSYLFTVNILSSFELLIYPCRNVDFKTPLVISPLTGSVTQCSPLWGAIPTDADGRHFQRQHERNQL